MSPDNFPVVQSERDPPHFPPILLSGHW